MNTAIDWELVGNALKRWIQQSTGLQTVMENEAQPFVDPSKKAICRLNITTIEQLGQDEQRTTLSGTDCVPERAGLRAMTVACRVESFTQELNETARAYLETARTGLRLDSVQALFRKANISLIEALPILNLDASMDQRIVSIGAFDARFHVAACLRDVDFPTVGTVTISGTVNDVDGAPVDGQLDLDLTL